MPRVRMPDGKTVMFPDDMPRDQMKAAAENYMKKITPREVKPEPDYWRGVAESAGSAIGGIGAGALSLVDPIPGDEPPAVLAGMALGGSMGGQAYDLVQGLLGRGPQQTVGGQVMRAAEDVGLGLAVPAVAAPVMQGVGRAAKATLSPIKSTLQRGVGPSGAQTLGQIERYEQAGFRPEIGMFENPEAQALSQSLRTGPFSGKIMAQVDRHNIERGAQLADEIARSYGMPRAPEGAGAIIRDQADKAQTRFFDGATFLYNKVKTFMPERIPATNLKLATKKVLDLGEGSELAKGYMSEPMRIASLATKDIAEDGTISQNTVDIIKEMSKSAYKKPIKTDADHLIMQIERAVDKDATEAAIKAGGDKANQAVEAAKTWWKAGVGNVKRGDVGVMDDTARILKTADDGKIYQWLMGEGKTGGERLDRVLSLMDDDAVGTIKATAFKELGLPTGAGRDLSGGGFSFNTFWSRYNNLSEGARETLFGRGSSAPMQSLKEAISYMKALEKRANVSQTENIRVWHEMLTPLMNGITFGGVGGFTGGSTLTGALVGGSLGAAGKGAQLAINNRAAKLISDPKFVKWLATTGKKLVVKPTDLGPQMVRLANIAVSSPENADAYMSYMSSLGFDTTKRTSKNGKTKIEVQ